MRRVGISHIAGDGGGMRFEVEALGGLGACRTSGVGDGSGLEGETGT